ncbi:MAG TPA: cytochrome c3 family protein [Candidatus Saccharimonadales bacterium]|nr:cytochrome c3 family protein [Candidatus Saccharimonadales bacterium]
MKLKRTAVAAMIKVFAGGGVLLLLNSCSTTPTAVVVPLEIPGAHYVGNKACMDCHAEIVREFPASPHGLIHSANLALAGGTGCESCHGPGSEHIESGGNAKFIINPGNDPSSCSQCHLDVQAEFNLPYHHPVIEGQMNCVQCHDPHGGDIFKPKGGLAMARQNESCEQCHREQTRPFVFEHEAMREGCTVCHDPHGSINRKMLVESDPNLCLRCHAEFQTPTQPPSILIGNVDHTGFLQIGTCWTAGCHTAIHGSNVDPLLRY